MLQSPLHSPEVPIYATDICLLQDGLYLGRKPQTSRCRSGQQTSKLLTFTFTFTVTVFSYFSIMKSLIQPAVWALVGSCYASPLARQIEKRQVESQMNDGEQLGVGMCLLQD